MVKIYCTCCRRYCGWSRSLGVIAPSYKKQLLASGTSLFTGGDISPNGKEVLVKDADKIYYYAPVDGDYLSALTHPGVEVPYHKERLGESVCWSADGSSYYTLGEDNHAVLYRYDRQ